MPQPTFTIGEFRAVIPRDSIIIDTNILVSAFHPGQDDHDSAWAFLEALTEGSCPPIVPLCVATEAWGLLVGSFKYETGGHRMLAWLNTPDTVLLFPHQSEPLPRVRQLVEKLKIDFVDATILCLATDLTEQCSLKPAIQVATLDTRDFIRCAKQPGVKIRLYDLRSNDEYGFGGD